jgi:serine/threonine protein kinase
MCTAYQLTERQNILVVNGPPQWWIKICDLGLSKQLTDTTAFQTKAGTQSYMAPEMLNYLDDDNDTGEYTNAVDLWAVGCIVYRLVTGKVPFPPGRLLMKYCSDKSLFPLDPLFDCDIKSDGAKFIRELLAPYPDDRPSASEALKHSWITAGEPLILLP